MRANKISLPPVKKETQLNYFPEEIGLMAERITGQGMG
jgi:hypothetical protein